LIDFHIPPVFLLYYLFTFLLHLIRFAFIQFLTGENSSHLAPKKVHLRENKKNAKGWQHFFTYLPVSDPAVRLEVIYNKIFTVPKKFQKNAGAVKEIPWPFGAGNFGFWRGFGEGACPQ